MGRHRLFLATVRRRVPAGRHRVARQHQRAKSLHRQPAEPSAGRAGRLLRHGIRAHYGQARRDRPDAASAKSVDAPCIAEFPLVLECAVVQTHELGLHTQFIGEIKDVKIDEACLDEAGNIDLDKLAPIALALDTRSRSSVEAGGYYAFGEPIGPVFSMGRAFS